MKFKKPNSIQIIFIMKITDMRIHETRHMLNFMLNNVIFFSISEIIAIFAALKDKQTSLII